MSIFPVINHGSGDELFRILKPKHNTKSGDVNLVKEKTSYIKLSGNSNQQLLNRGLTDLNTSYELTKMAATTK